MLSYYYELSLYKCNLDFFKIFTVNVKNVCSVVLLNTL